ncbi:hypothetical protein ACFQZO_37005 [Bradyrhizobium sp. GCM10027634]|uniref:hypothetical protein n=1 Tax=unclassified Bradyrhizobium TaxID=2631580 RepID=UPI00263BB7BA|nr:hypothetical protein [Bradyrhizobium sp. WYCCWR 12677]MDN5006415.1 hypothetical protein [Bradyrhizobium sp. WYCCWR 12677]
MEEIEGMVAQLAKLHGREGMRAIATMMYSLGSDATITFADGTYIPCDFIMQMAWANGGEPTPDPGQPTQVRE